MKRFKKSRRKNPFPSSIPKISENDFEDDIGELNQVRKAYFKMIEYLELCDSDKDFENLLKDRKTRYEIDGLFELIAGGAEDIQLSINNSLDKVVKLADYLHVKYKLES